MLSSRYLFYDHSYVGVWQFNERNCRQLWKNNAAHEERYDICVVEKPADSVYDFIDTYYSSTKPHMQSNDTAMYSVHQLFLNMRYLDHSARPETYSTWDYNCLGCKIYFS